MSTSPRLSPCRSVQFISHNSLALEDVAGLYSPGELQGYWDQAVQLGQEVQWGHESAETALLPDSRGAGGDDVPVAASSCAAEANAAVPDLHGLTNFACGDARRIQGEAYSPMECVKSTPSWVPDESLASVLKTGSCKAAHAKVTTMNLIVVMSSTAVHCAASHTIQIPRLFANVEFKAHDASTLQAKMPSEDEDDEFGWFLSGGEGFQEGSPAVGLNAAVGPVGSVAVGVVAEPSASAMGPEGRFGTQQGRHKDLDPAVDNDLKVWGAEATITLISPLDAPRLDLLLGPSSASFTHAQARRPDPPLLMPRGKHDLLLDGATNSPSRCSGLESKSQDEGDMDDSCDWFFGGRAAREEAEELSTAGVIPRDVLMALGKMLQGSGMVDKGDSDACSKGVAVASPAKSAAEAPFDKPRSQALPNPAPVPPSYPGQPRMSPAQAHLAALGLSLGHGHDVEMLLAVSIMAHLLFPSTLGSRSRPPLIGSGSIASATALLCWERHVDVKVLPGRPLHESRVIPGAGFLLEEAEQRQMSRILSACSSEQSPTNNTCQPTTDDNCQLSTSSAPCFGGVVRAVFIDGPLLIPRSLTHQFPLAASQHEEAQGGDSSQGGNLLQTAEEADELVISHFRSWLNGPEQNKASSPPSALLPRATEDTCPFFSTSCSTSPSPAPVLVLCSGHAPPRFVDRLREQTLTAGAGVFVLQGLGAKAVRGAASACDASLYGPEPWASHPASTPPLMVNERTYEGDGCPAQLPSPHPPAIGSCPSTLPLPISPLSLPGAMVQWRVQELGRPESVGVWECSPGGDRGAGPSPRSCLLTLRRPTLPEWDGAVCDEKGGHDQGHELEGGRHGWPFATVLLHAPVPAMAEAVEAALHRCFRRLQSTLAAAADGWGGGGAWGKVLPALGVTELGFAVWLRRAARERPPHQDLKSEPQSGDKPAPAWKLLNAELSEDEAAFRGEVLEAVAESMQDVATTVLQVGWCGRVWMVSLSCP